MTLLLCSLIVLAASALGFAHFQNRNRRRAEATLKISEARYRATLAAFPDVLYVMTRDGVICDYHARDVGALAVPPERFLDRSLRAAMPASISDLVERGVAAAAATDETVVLEYALAAGDRGSRDYEARIVRWGGSRVLAIVRDISDRKQFERALRERETALIESHRENQALAGRLIVAQEAERRRIARDLHDDLCQKLALLNIEIDQLAAGRIADWRRLEDRLRRLSVSVAEIAKDVHDLSHEVHPSKLETLGLVTAIDALCRDISRKHGIIVDFRHRGDPQPRVDVQASLHLYRIVQEALHNIVKHSGGEQALVELDVAARMLNLRIADNGCGFAPGRDGLEGLGLVSMRERVRIIGGRLAIHSSPGRGTRLGVRLALDAAPALDRESRRARVGSHAEIA